jgi:hypothetical protein
MVVFAVASDVGIAIEKSLPMKLRSILVPLQIARCSTYRRNLDFIPPLRLAIR